MYDLVIRNGFVVDGSGGPRYPADVGVKDGRIVKVGRIRERAQGRAVTRQHDGRAVLGDVRDRRREQAIEQHDQRKRDQRVAELAVAAEPGRHLLPPSDLKPPFALSLSKGECERPAACDLEGTVFDRLRPNGGFRSLRSEPLDEEADETLTPATPP